MKVLIVGGAGYVGQIVVPYLEKFFDCWHFDIKPVQGAEQRTLVADVGNEDAVQQAVADKEAVLYLAMGWGKNKKDMLDCNVIGPAFDVNVRGLYRFLYYGLAAGVKRFVYASTLSVYKNFWGFRVTEAAPADSWYPYGLSKRVGEFICQCASQEYPDRTISALRLILPRNEQDWPAHRYNPQLPRNSCAIGPNDTRRLFEAALRLDKPGFHLAQASGDMEGRQIPNDRVFELLGWKPQND